MILPPLYIEYRARNQWSKKRPVLCVKTNEIARARGSSRSRLHGGVWARAARGERGSTPPYTSDATRASARDYRIVSSSLVSHRPVVGSEHKVGYWFLFMIMTCNNKCNNSWLLKQFTLPRVAQITPSGRMRLAGRNWTTTGLSRVQ